MKITVLDKGTMGEDTPFDDIKALGEVTLYDYTEPHELIKNVADSEVIVLNKVKIGREVFENAKNLKLICVFATGYDNIDILSAREHGVAVCNVPGYSTDSVTLYTISCALALYSKLFEYNSFVRSGEYTESGCANKLTPVFHELKGKTWGIIGLGNIGKAVAKVAEAFGARVIANKRTPDENYNCVDIDTLCKESDIISVHCPLNEQTRNIINKDRISLMKPSVIIVNEARGAVLDESDIADAIKDRRIGGFGCDVYSHEPFSKNHPYDKIKNYNNVILTPHCAWGAYEARERCQKTIADNISAFYSGEIKNRVDL